MVKKLLLFLLALSASMHARIYLPAGLTVAKLQQTNKIQFAYDIHGVFAVKKTGISLNTIGLGFSYIFGNDAWDAIGRRSHLDISGEGQAAIARKYGHTKLARMIEKEANRYKPRKGMEAIVQRIHAQGFTQRVASNIGPNFLINLDSRFRRKYKSNIFTYMQPGLTVNYSALSSNPKSLPSTSMVGKPSREFYQTFNALYNPQSTDYIIFIDDKLENVLSAVKEGWIGIHFNTAVKNPVQQFERDLYSLGIFSGQARGNH